MTATYNPAEVERLCDRMQRWEDHSEERDGTCVKCGETIRGHEPEHEPSPLCNACAQDLATRTLPDQLEDARAEIERLRSELVDRDASIVQLVAQRDEYQRQADQQRARIVELEGELRVRDDQLDAARDRILLYDQALLRSGDA